MRIVGDTCWYVDLTTDRNGARAYYAAHAQLEVVPCVIVRGELRMGRRSPIRIDAVFGTGEILAVDRDVADLWGDLGDALKRSGMSIGPNDLWIAAIAIRNGLPVLTRNVGEFSRVPGLTVVAYGESP